MTTTTTATDIENIRMTLARYCQTVDDGDYRAWSELFAEDGVFEVMGNEHRGRDQILAFVEKSLGSRGSGRIVHIVNASVIDVDGDTANGSTSWFSLRVGPDATVVNSTGRYNDRFVRQGDAWLFAEHRISIFK